MILLVPDIIALRKLEDGRIVISHTQMNNSLISTFEEFTVMVLCHTVGNVSLGH